MPNYLSPGVYVEEVEAGSRPIEGVGTAVAAFVGLAARGPDQRADARHQLGAVRQHLRRLHRGLVPRPRRLRLLPERRRRLLRRPHRRRLRRCPRRGPSSRAAKDGSSARLPRSIALEPGPAGNADQGRRHRGRPDAEGDTFKLTVSAPGTRRRGLRRRHDQARQEQRRDRGQGAVEAHPARGDRHGQRRSSACPPRARSRSPAPTSAKPVRLTPGRLRRRLRRSDRVRRPRGRRRASRCSPSPT